MIAAPPLIAHDTPITCAMDPATSEPITDDKPTTTNEYAAISRPRNSFGARCWSIEFAEALLTIIAKPTPRRIGYAYAGRRTSEKAISSIENAVEANASTVVRRHRSPTAASVNAPVTPPTPTQASNAP